MTKLCFGRIISLMSVRTENLSSEVASATFVENQSEPSRRRLIAYSGASATAGALFGAAAGLSSTAFRDTEIHLADGVNIYAGLRTYDGLQLKSGHCKVYLKNLQIDTHLPILNGVSITTQDKNLLCRNPNEIIQDSRLQTLSTIASQRKQAIIQPVKDSFIAKAEQGAAVGALGFALIPVLGAVAMKKFPQLNISEKMKNFAHQLKNNKRWSIGVGTASAAALVGCGATLGGDIVNDPISGKGIPGQLRIYLPDATKNAVVEGEEVKDAVNALLRDVNRGDRIWERIRLNLMQNVALQSKSKPGFEYLYDPDHKYRKTLIESGVLCSTGLTEKILPLLQSDIRPDITIDSGDRQIAGGKNKFLERHCEPNLTRNYHSKYIFTKGNHDSTENNDVVVSKIDGQTFVTMPDPRSRLGKEDRSGLIGDELKLALAKQGRIIALKTCEIYYNTGIKPDVVTHTFDSARETISKGCANNIYTGHPVFGHVDLSKGSVLKAYLSSDGSTSTDVLISTSSSGSVKTNTPYREPQKTGDVVVKYSLLPSTSFVKAAILSWKSDGNTTIILVNPPKAEKLPQIIQ